MLTYWPMVTMIIGLGRSLIDMYFANKFETDVGIPLIFPTNYVKGFVGLEFIDIISMIL